MFATTFAIYCLAVLLIGFLAARQSKAHAEDVYLAGRHHSHWTAALSAGASTESGFVMLGMVGMGYTVGANCFWIVPAGILGYMLNWGVLAPSIRSKSAKIEALSVPEFFRKTTSGQKGAKLASLIASLLSVVFLLVYTGAQLSAAGKAIASEFSISYLPALTIGTVVILLYTILGGFRAVSWTDNLQAGMMLISLVAIPVMGLIHVGGFSALFQKLASINPSLASFTSGATGLKGVAMAALPWLMLGLAYPGQPHAVSRLMATGRDANFNIAAAVGIVWFVLLYSGAILLGMTVRAGFAENVSTSDAELLLPGIASSVVPGILGGVMLASIIAAISSTADSTLFASASTVTRDLIPKLEQTSVGKWVKASVIFIGILAFVFAAGEVRAIFDLVLYAWSGLGASLGPSVLYAALVKQPRAIALNSGLITGGTLAFLVHAHPLNLLIAFGFSACAIGIFHWFSSTHKLNETS